MKLKEDLIKFRPFNEQESCDRDIMLRLLEREPDIFQRQNLTAHFTASSWLVNETHNKVLMIYHNLYHSWAWTGGHADGETNLLWVAQKEAEEETGIAGLRALGTDIFSLEILTVDGHRKNGRYVPSHLHLNVTYLLEGSEKAPLRMKPDENSGVKWFSLREAVKASSEPWMAEHVYDKLNQKLIKWRECEREESGNKTN